MADTKWEIKGREFANCNCDYACPCQFNSLPTHGNCKALVGIEIERGYHGDTKLDGLRIVGVYDYPGPIHLGNGQAYYIIDERANKEQRTALLRIMRGEDTAPAATMLNVYHSMLSKEHNPVFAKINFDLDIGKRTTRISVDGYVDTRGEPIRNPVTNAEHRIRIEPVGGFEFKKAEIGRGWTRTSGDVTLALADSYGQFAELHLNQDGVVN